MQHDEHETLRRQRKPTMMLWGSVTTQAISYYAKRTEMMLLVLNSPCGRVKVPYCLPQTRTYNYTFKTYLPQCSNDLAGVGVMSTCSYFGDTRNMLMNPSKLRSEAAKLRAKPAMKCPPDMWDEFQQLSQTFFDSNDNINVRLARKKSDQTVQDMSKTSYLPTCGQMLWPWPGPVAWEKRSFFFLIASCYY